MSNLVEAKDKNVHDGHRERFKESFIRGGIDQFTDHQSLELLLFYSIARKDTNKIAHRLIDKYGSLHAVFEAELDDLEKIPGITRNSAILMKLIPSMSKKYSMSKNSDVKVLDSSHKASLYVKNLFLGETNEVFFMISLNTRKKFRFTSRVSDGTINEAYIHIRRIVEEALLHKADSVILCHNHPGGSLEPSRSDIETTKTIKSALELIKVKVIDHIIVAGDGYYSFADNGII